MDITTLVERVLYYQHDNNQSPRKTCIKQIIITS